MKKTFRLIALLLCFVLVACTLAGCGGGKTEEAAKRDELVIAYRNEPANLDPTGNTALTAFAINFQTFDRLIVNNGDGTFSPSLAKSWEQIDDLTFRFYLQEGVKFHDGTEMTAEDVAFSIARAEKSSYSSSFFGYFDGEHCEAVDKYTVDIRTYEPFAPFLTYLSSSRGSVVPKAYVEKVGDEAFGREPIGTGPFKFESWTSGDRIVVTKFDDYWDKTKTYAVNKIVNRIVTDTSARAIEVESGNVDIALHIAENDAKRLSEGKDTKVQSGPSYTTVYLRWNTVDFDIYDENMRKAICYCLDMDAIVNAAYGDGGVKGTAVIASSLMGHKDVTANDYNVDKAKEYLAKAVADGFDLSQTYVIALSNDSQMQNAAQAMMNTWKNVLGFNVEIETYDSATMSSMINAGEVPFTMGSTNASSGDPDHGLFVYKGVNCNTHHDATLSDMISKAAAEFDNDKRVELYGEILEYCHDINVTYPVAYTNVFYGMRGDVEGLDTHPGYTPDFTKVYFK